MSDKGQMEGSEELVHVHREIVKEATQSAVVAANARAGGPAIVRGSAPRVKRTGGFWRFGDKLNGEKKLGG